MDSLMAFKPNVPKMVNAADAPAGMGGAVRRILLIFLMATVWWCPFGAVAEDGANPGTASDICADPL